MSTPTDAQFDIRSISSSRVKFYHAVSVLPQDVASQILDLIRAPPASEPYEFLRERLIKLYTLMNRMLALLPNDYKPDFILSGLFLQHLPIDVRSHLLREKVDNPRALALRFLLAL